jgi:hypothetical protein
MQTVKAYFDPKIREDRFLYYYPLTGMVAIYTLNPVGEGGGFKSIRLKTWDPLVKKIANHQSLRILNYLSTKLKGTGGAKILLLNTSACEKFKKEDFRVFPTVSKSWGMVNTWCLYPLIEFPDGRVFYCKFTRNIRGGTGIRLRLLKLVNKPSSLTSPEEVIMTAGKGTIRCYQASCGYHQINKIQCHHQCETCFGQGERAFCPGCKQMPHVCPICNTLIMNTQSHLEKYHQIMNKKWPSKVEIKNHPHTKLISQDLPPETVEALLNTETGPISPPEALRSNKKPRLGPPAPHEDVQSAAEILMRMGRHDEPPKTDKGAGGVVNPPYKRAAKRLKSSHGAPLGENQAPGGEGV